MGSNLSRDDAYPSKFPFGTKFVGYKCQFSHEQRHQLQRQKLGQEQLQQQPHRHHGHRQHQEQSNQQQPQQQHPVSLLRRSSSVVISMKADKGGTSCGGGCSRSFSSGWYSALLTTSFFLGDVSASLHAGDCLICTVIADKDKIKNGHHGAVQYIGTAAWSPPPPT